MNADVAARLAAAGCIAAAAEAAELVAASPDAATLDAWVARREAGEPLAWITGSTTFAGRSLAVDPGVYVPRPQTEGLATRAVALLPAGGRLLDVCAGAGAIAVHVQRSVPGATVVATERDPTAARCARRNGVAVVVADVAAPLRGPFDVVTAVPPYVPTAALATLPRDVLDHEPRRALDGGPDGLAVARRVARDAARLLRPGGWLLLELGGDQPAQLGPTLAGAFTAIEVWTDPEGDARGLAARRRSSG